MATLTDLTLEELRARALFFGVHATDKYGYDRTTVNPWRLEELGANRPRHLILRKYPAWFVTERDALTAYLAEMKAHHYPDRLPDAVTA